MVELFINVIFINEIVSNNVILIRLCNCESIDPLSLPLLAIT